MPVLKTTMLIQKGYLLKQALSIESVMQLFPIDETIVKKDTALLVLWDGMFKLEFGYHKNALSYFSVEPYANSSLKEVFDDDLYLFGKSQVCIEDYLPFTKINEERWSYKDLSFYFDEDKKLTAIFQNFE